MNGKLLVWIFIFSTAVSATFAQTAPRITVGDILEKNTFAPKSVTGVNWMNNGRYYTSQVDADNQQFIIQYDVTTGNAVDTVLTSAVLAPTGSNAPINFDEYQFSADERKLLLRTGREPIYRRSFKADYYVYDLNKQTLTELSPNGKESYATFSPDGRKIAFTRDNNLFMVDLAAMRQQAITTDGKFNFLIHGSSDWVYEEEFSFAQAFAWSPDSRKIAYYTFDESHVREYNMQVWGGLYPKDYRFKYPKAGEENSKITISVFHLDKNQPVKMDIGTETDIYIPRINWTNDPNVLSIRRMNRLQNQLDLLHADATTGKSNVILTEKSEAYVDLDFTDDLTYLNDGKRFIFTSERDGYKHIYLYAMDGTLERQITSGNWEVSEFLGMDEKSKLVYFTSTEVSPLERHLYSVRVTGKSKKQLTDASGMHQINFSPDFKYYLDYQASANAPTVVSLHQAPGGKAVKTLENNETLAATIKRYDFRPKEFFQFKTVDGSTLNGWMIKPADFDAGKKYPVLMFVYGGPGSQTVTRSWDSNLAWFQMLAQNGIIVASVDNRGTGGRGAAFRQATYANLGKLEVQDQMEAAKHLGSQPFVDKNRIGIYGWSYGGYMASMAMTVGADYFSVGIAGAPVTSWRFYDSIYTERYMKTPQLNADGYNVSSPIQYANRLKGKFLLIHGTGDDNVHFQNSVALESALIDAGKQFRSFYYPNQSHGVRGKARVHLYQMMTVFLVENLKNGTQM